MLWVGFEHRHFFSLSFQRHSLKSKIKTKYATLHFKKENRAPCRQSKHIFFTTVTATVQCVCLMDKPCSLRTDPYRWGLFHLIVCPFEATASTHGRALHSRTHAATAAIAHSALLVGFMVKEGLSRKQDSSAPAILQAHWGFLCWIYSNQCTVVFNNSWL